MEEEFDRLIATTEFENQSTYFNAIQFKYSDSSQTLEIFPSRNAFQYLKKAKKKLKKLKSWLLEKSEYNTAWAIKVC